MTRNCGWRENAKKVRPPASGAIADNTWNLRPCLFSGILPTSVAAALRDHGWSVRSSLERDLTQLVEALRVGTGEAAKRHPGPTQRNHVVVTDDQWFGQESVVHGHRIGDLAAR